MGARLAGAEAHGAAASPLEAHRSTVGYWGRDAIHAIRSNGRRCGARAGDTILFGRRSTNGRGDGWRRHYAEKSGALAVIKNRAQHFNLVGVGAKAEK
jgi:hypothetical protein